MELLHERFDVNETWQQAITQNKLRTLMTIGDAYEELLEVDVHNMKLSKKEYIEIGCLVHLVMEVEIKGRMCSVRKSIWLEDQAFPNYELSTIFIQVQNDLHRAVIRVESEGEDIALSKFMLREFFVSELPVRIELERVMTEAFNQVESLFLSELTITKTKVG